MTIIIAGSATILFAVLFTLSTIRILKYALAINESIARGNLRSNIEIVGRDEFAVLLQSAHRMQNHLRETMRLIVDSSTQLTSAADQMGVVTGESNRGLQHQNSEIEFAAVAVTQMTSAVDEVARNASSASAGPAKPVRSGLCTGYWPLAD
jgi:methyl-accepting chemotaxis protein